MVIIMNIMISGIEFEFKDLQDLNVRYHNLSDVKEKRIIVEKTNSIRECFADKIYKEIIEDDMLIRFYSNAISFIFDNKIILLFDLYLKTIFVNEKLSYKATFEIISKKIIPYIYYESYLGIPIHATAIKTEQGLICLAGISSVGKSTLAANFIYRHLGTLYTDDILCVEEKCGTLFPHSNFSLLKLREESSKFFGDYDFNANSLRYNMDSNTSFIKTFFVLHKSENKKITFKKLCRDNNLEILMRNLFSPYMCKFSREFVDLISRISKLIEIVEVEFPHDYNYLNELTDLVLKYR